MKKIFKNLGLSAGIAFAFLFATSMIVAQEQANAPKDKVEVKKSVDAKVSKESDNLLSPQWFEYATGQPIHLVSSYSPLNGPVNTLCPEGNLELCAIFVTPNDIDGLTPDLTELTTMVPQIQAAVTDGESIPNLIRIKN